MNAIRLSPARSTSLLDGWSRRFAQTPRSPALWFSAGRATLLILAGWDADVFAHCECAARGLVRLAPRGCAEEWYWAGLLHDIGKITLPSELLRKRGALTRAERKQMERHAPQGAALLKAIGAPRAVVQAAKFHHERWDGTGYPFDIRGRQIPHIARALAVADVYAALTSDRPYRQAFTPAQARLEIERKAELHFDAELVAQFFASADRGEEDHA